jgi:hypothetical protein
MLRLAFTAFCILVTLAANTNSGRSAEPLPKFTEEREAAAMHFVRKHCPELVPLLDELKKANKTAYETQIRETFQITEFLADIQEDDPKRYDLELKMWKAENKALVLVAKLATPKEDTRKIIEEQLQSLAKELVDLELQSFEHRVEILQSELVTAKDELSKFRDNIDRTAKDRFQAFLDKAKRKKP